MTSVATLIATKAVHLIGGPLHGLVLRVPRASERVIASHGDHRPDDWRESPASTYSSTGAGSPFWIWRGVLTCR